MGDLWGLMGGGLMGRWANFKVSLQTKRILIRPESQHLRKVRHHGGRIHDSLLDAIQLQLQLVSMVGGGENRLVHHPVII